MADEIDLSDEFDPTADLVPSKSKKGGNKKLSVERIYQKKTQLEHILLRPDTYIGSVEPVTQPMWVYDEGVGMRNREITFVPGLYKIFDEILVNAADNKQRDSKMDCIKIEINPEENRIYVYNNGQGIPVVEHKDEKMFVPSLIFGHLLTSSNYNDEERKVTGGRNGYGAKLCNIFSTKFTVETAAKQYGKQFKQTWYDNMGKSDDPKITSYRGTDFTCVTFYPDLSKFKMTVLDKDIVALMTRRAYDIAGCSKGVKVFLNGERLGIKSFKDYIELYLKDKNDEQDEPLKVIHEQVNERWEIAVTLSDRGFQQVSFVNSIATTKGGRHVDYITDQLTAKISEVVKKRNKSGKDVRPFQIKTHLWVFVNCLIENPTFDSQTKENMTLQIKNFGSKCQLTEKFVNQSLKCGVVESIMSWVQFKARTELEKKCSGKKQTKLKGIPKLEDANDAGTRNSIDCTLILTEGDSAKSLAVSGLGVVGRDKYGVFPLKGKILNVREATHKQILENAEINNIIKIMGLQYKKKYESIDDLKTLRYGRLMIMTDQDQDGSHIKGLLINFIHYNWPSLLRLPFLEEFITPIVKASKGNEEYSFYSLPEFEEWKQTKPNWNKYKVKYYKGLGTSTAKEAKEYFSDMLRHRIKFQYNGTDDDNAIKLAFSKKMIDNRKEWLTNGMEERKRRRELGLPELYLYGKDTKRVSYNEFVNKELILFSNMDNERSIPSMVDGLKPGQRKIIYTCLLRKDKEVKVAQLSGAVAEKSAYHHGEVSLTATIVNLAQNYVGSNNINLLMPIGQFGTRLQGGKDAASPRYIFTALNPVTRHIFPVQDTPLLNHLFDDNLRIEPEYYIPILPMVLVNGAEGIGTGWSTKLANYNPRDLVKNINRMLDGEEPLEMLPWYKGFRGTIDRLHSSSHFLISGEISLLENSKIEITELPIKVWTQSYKESVLEPMLHGNEKTPPFIQDYKEYNTDTTIRFVITMSPEKLAQARSQGLHKVFKLQTTLTLNSMVLFDKLNVLRKFDSPEQILKEFYEIRYDLYIQRKNYLVGILEAEALKLKNQARFILEKIENKIIVENKKKKEMIKTLQDKGYDSDPVETWKKANKYAEMKDPKEREDSDKEGESDKEDYADSGAPNYNYLLGMTMWSLTKEQKDKLLMNRDKKIEELENLKKKTPADLWRDDLNAFMKALDEQEKAEQQEEAGSKNKIKAKMVGKKKKNDEDTKPSLFGERVVPTVDEEFKKKFIPKESVEKKRRIKKEPSDKKDEDDDDVNAPSFAERVAGSPKKMKKELKQTTLKFESIGEKPKRGRNPKGQSPKKGKKRNPWSDESEEDEPSDMSDVDLEDYIPPEKREGSPRKAAVNRKKYIDDDSDVDEFDAMKSSEDEKSDKVVTNNNTAKKLNGAAPPMSESDDDISNAPAASNANDLFDSLLGEKSSDEKPPLVESQKRFNASSDESDVLNEAPKKKARKNSSSDDDFKLEKKKPAPKKKTASKKKTDAPKKTKAAPKAKKPRKKFDSDDDFGENLSVDEDTAAAIRAVANEPRTGRQKAPKSYKFDDFSDDDDF